MVKKTATTPPSDAPTKLTISRTDAASRLDERISIGDGLRKRPIGSLKELEMTRSEYHSWGEFNSELLSRIFDGPQYKLEYESWGRISVPMNPSLGQQIDQLHNDIASDCRRLKSLRDRLDLIDETPTSVPSGATNPNASRKVFIVHGHDEALKQEVARFVEKLGLQAVILAEQPNGGRTIIEKFEVHAENVGFAIVLLTPDDVGGVGSSANASQKPRARQNVILELGYFVGTLKRARVCALHKGNVELPSDIHGVLYVSVDKDWKLLAREMKNANLPIDLNLVLD